MLAHLYAAEALVLMDKLSDAVEHLNPENVSDISLIIPKEESNEEDEIPMNTRPQASKTNNCLFVAVYTKKICVKIK